MSGNPMTVFQVAGRAMSAQLTRMNTTASNLANAGGVCVSYYEWIQNKRSESWNLREVDSKLKERLRSAYERVREFSEEHKVSRRTAALAVAVQRVSDSYRERGIFP